MPSNHRFCHVSMAWLLSLVISSQVLQADVTTPLISEGGLNFSPSDSCTAGNPAATCDEGVSLLQRHAHILVAEDHTTATSSPSLSTCTELANHGSYFSAEIRVGTPPQRFDVVADTGSDAVIIPSCICQENGQCSKQDKCFTGSNKSTTFRVSGADTSEVPIISMEFGSGTITSAVVTDMVGLGSVNANMSAGLLLMVDRQLDIAGPFEGILGLGQLQSEYHGTSSNDHKGRQAGWDKPQDGQQEQAPTDTKDQLEIPGFLRRSKVDRFSICFNDGVAPGVLRLNTPKSENPLPSVGTMHWGLEFGGMSIGAVNNPTLFCGNGTDTSCGAIPDSGTTVIMGPEDNIRSLFAGLCDEWPRCSATLVANGMFHGMDKEEAFQRTLLACEDWLQESKGLDELPSIHMHLGGPSGGQHHVELSPWSYIFQSPMDEFQQHTALLGNIGLTKSATLQASRVGLGAGRAYGCLPAFGAAEMSLSSSVWIVGTPLFYEYVVNYDLSDDRPSISFSSEPCGTCNEKNTALLAHSNAGRGRGGVRHIPRRIKGPLRVGKHAAWKNRKNGGKAKRRRNAWKKL